jgi:hypothetical protein
MAAPSGIGCASGTAPAATTAAVIGEVQAPHGVACLLVATVMA